MPRHQLVTRRPDPHEDEPVYKTGDMARFGQCDTNTIRRYAKRGILSERYTESGQTRMRLFTERDRVALLKHRGLLKMVSGKNGHG